MENADLLCVCVCAANAFVLLKSGGEFERRLALFSYAQTGREQKR